MRLRKQWSKTESRKIAFLRTATTTSSDKRNGYGKMKVRNAPRPVTLAPLPPLRDFDAEEKR